MILGLRIIMERWQQVRYVSQKQCNMNWIRIGVWEWDEISHR